MKSLRVEISDPTDERLNKFRNHAGAKSYIVRAALELYLTLREKGILNGTEKVEELSSIGKEMSAVWCETRPSGEDG